MLFSPAAYMNYFELKKAYQNQPLESYNQSSGTGAALGTVAAIFIVLLIIDIVLLVFAVHFTMKCSKANNWPGWVTFLLIVSFFIPYIGGALSLGMIIYGLVACK